MLAERSGIHLTPERNNSLRFSIHRDRRAHGTGDISPRKPPQPASGRQADVSLGNLDPKMLLVRAVPARLREPAFRPWARDAVAVSSPGY
jgi:hypothetical protein